MEEAPPKKADAATRKRRSSILKSQRAPRTPFSELEFNVATPTDTAKSRRVSFSRRTGVAEFATNEATTTWKNVYEEHNKSLETSGNDSRGNANRQTASSGRRSFFDKQFQEVEGVDFVETLNPRNPNFNTSVSHINFTNQLAGLDCTEGDKKLEAPQQHFEFSSFTDHQTKLFEDDIGLPIMGEVSDRIDLNFSMMQTIGSKDKDDLEQLQKDLQEGRSNRNCPSSFRDGKDLSEYIEFDLNMTHAPVHEDVSDMSITDTILSPKVQNVSKSSSVLQKSKGNNDWAADKENIVLNPYAAPREADNFAINEEPDKVLVFDGKRLTIQKTNTSTIENEHVVKEPQRKTIVLNMHDDLPNFVDELSVSKQLAHKFDNNEKSVDDISNISMTQSVPSNIFSGQVTIHERRRKILFNDVDILSVTQTQPTNVIIPEQFNVFDDKTNKTLSNDDCDISMTQAVIKNVILTENSAKSKRNTIVFDNTSGDISMTQALPANLLLTQTAQGKSDNETMKFYNNDISMTQALSANIILDACSSDNENVGRRKTILYDENSGDISCTQAIPSNIILPQPNTETTNITTHESYVLEETQIDNKRNISTYPTIPESQDKENNQGNKRKTIVFYDDAADISVTQAIPTNILNAKDAENAGRRKTIVYDEISGDISCTQVIPTNIILPQPDMESTVINTDKSISKSYVLEHTLFNNTKNISTNPILPEQSEDKENNRGPKRKTIVFFDDAANISVTQAIPTNILNAKDAENAGGRKTIVYDENSGDISCTQVIPTNIILPQPDMESTVINTDKSISKSYVLDRTLFDNTKNISTNPILPEQSEDKENNRGPKRKTIVFFDDAADISVTQAIPTNILNAKDAENAGRRKTIVYDENSGDISCTQVIPTNIILPQINMESTTINTEKTYVLEETLTDTKRNLSINPTLPEQTTENNQSSKRKTIVFEDEAAYISMTQAIPTNIFSTKSTTRKTILFEQDVGDISVTQAIPNNIIMNDLSDTNVVRQCENINNSHINKLETSLKNKSNLLNSQELETKGENDDDLINIKASDILNREDLSKTQDVLDQISAIIDSSNTKPPSENSETLYQSRNSIGKSINITSNTTCNQASKTDEITMKPNQNILIYQTSTNHGNIYSRKRNLSQENTSEPDTSYADNPSSGITSSNSAYSKHSDVIMQLVSVSQSVESREENPVFTSDENILLQNVESSNLSTYVSSKTSSAELIVNTNKSEVSKRSPDKMKSMLNELLDMSNASIDPEVKLATPKSINKSTVLSKSVKANVNYDTDVDTDRTELSNDPSTADDDRMIYIIQDKNVDSDIKNTENVILPILHKLPKSPIDDVIGGVKPISNEFQSIVERKSDLMNETVKESKMVDLDKSFTRNLEISVQNMQNDVPKKEPLTDSNEGSYSKGYLSIIKDSTDEINVPRTESDSNSIDVECGVDEKCATDIIVETKRRSIAPRQSMINREDFLNNISMAQQILQNTKLDMDTSMNDATTECTLEDMDDSEEYMEVNRTNSEVVKKLHFEDESTTEYSVKAEVSKESPLRKSYSQPESSQETESKFRVIPSYLKYVDDELKDLMNDLVKPTADTMPFEGLEENSEHAPHMPTVPEREVSMCSNQIQANLIASSQIDMNIELCSESESLNNFGNVTQSRIKSVSFASAIKMTEESDSDVSSRNESIVNRQSILQVSPKTIRPHSRTTFSVSNPVIVFDDHNPLNNVLLSPILAGESSFKHEPCIPKMASNADQQERVSVQYRFKSLTEVDSPLQSGDNTEITSQSELSNSDKESVTNHQLCEKKDTTVNTIIAMRGNQDLLKVSSLTLVEDSQPHNTDSDMATDDLSDDKISQQSIISNKAKKRYYSPRSKNSIGSSNSSPNPSSKMIKISNSPKINNEKKTRNVVSSSDELSVLETSSTQENNDTKSTLEVIYTSGNNPNSSSKKPKKKRFSLFRKSKNNTVDLPNSVSSPTASPEQSDVAKDVRNVKKILKNESDLSPPPISRRRGSKHVKFPKAKKSGKSGTNLTVQHLSTEYGRRSDVLEPHLPVESAEKIDVTKNVKTVGDVSMQADVCSDSISSWTSNLSTSRIASVNDSNCTVFSKIYKEPHHLASEVIPKSVAREGDSVNVVPKIENLPDIGSNKCRWEVSGLDTWSFSLLHGRLRLCVRFQHRVDNALKSFVRADTPVHSINLYTAYQDESNTIAALCANFTAGAIRYIISHSTCDRAGAVPTLLRKSLALVRVALNWARVMHEAWYRLAFKLHDENKLSLKVANIPLRSVWEVTMRFELVVHDEGEVPWPKAMDVQVHEVLSEVKITEREIPNLLVGFPNDWSHVPRTLWKVFKYLKDMKKDDMGWPAV